MSDRETERINAAMNREDWPAAQRLIERALEGTPDDHWLLTRMGTALYEQRAYDRALEWSRKAIALAPLCPLTLSDYASALDMTGHTRQAIRIWQKLLKRGVERIATGECGEGKRWSESLLNDCRYRIGLAYLDLREQSKALRYLREHLAHRRPGLPSLYTMAEVRKALSKAGAGPALAVASDRAEAGAR